ncbi:MAG: DHA2 family efflux MFS transporter permease subunit [Anaerolineae bacterium]
MAIAAQPAPRDSGGAVLLATILASSMAFIDSSALDVAVPALQADLGLNGSQLLWVVNAYLLLLSALILVGGALGDRYGRKRIFMIGIVLFSGASMACGLAQDANFLILARAVQGVGGALMVPGSLAIISAYFPDERRGTAIGTWSTFSTLTTLGGPIIGGWLAGHGLWRLVFFINLPLAAIALYTLITRVPESRDEHAPDRLDFVGAALATLGLAGLTYGFLQAPDFGLSDPRVLGALVVGVIALAAFVFVESRSDHPMMPLRLFRSRTFSGTNLLTLFLYAALRVAPFFLILNLIQVQGYPPEVAGFTFVPFTILLTLMSRWAGGLIDRVGARLPLIVGPAIAALGFGLMTLPGLTTGPDAYWTTFFPAIVVLGIGMGITVAPLTTAVMGAAPKEMSGTASGINNAVARTAGVLAVAIIGALAIGIFTSNLEARAASLDIPAGSMDALRAQAAQFGAAQPPADLSAEQAAAVSDAIKLAFVDTFRVIAGIATALGALSAIMAALLVEARPAAARRP